MKGLIVEEGIWDEEEGMWKMWKVVDEGERRGKGVFVEEGEECGKGGGYGRG